MGRPPTIDRDRVLDIAEGILLKEGTGALTLDAVAKAAGISKGGVQSRFGTKDELIGAMILRWGREYDAELVARVGPRPTPQEAVRGHVQATLGLDEAEHARAAGLMAALIEGTHHRAECKAWYAERFGGVDLHTSEGRRAKLALLATEGAFILRAFGLMEFSEDEWREVHEGVRLLLDGKI